MGNTTTTRGSRRRERTRERLMQAGRELITEKGVAGLRIGEITERADVALGSFYNHFESKEELVDAVVGESLEALAASVAGADVEDVDPAEVVAAAIRRFVRLADDDPDFAQLCVHLNHADTVFASAVQPFARFALQRAIDAGRLDSPDVDVSLTTIMGGSLALMRAVVDGRIPTGAGDAYAEMVLRSLGLAPDAAREIAHRPLPDAVRAAA
jgi:AcrR family transcriptional regulator